MFTTTKGDDMQSNSARTLRGVSIAIMVISIIALVISVLMGFLFGGLGAVSTDPELASSMTMSVEADDATMQSLEELGLSAEDAPMLLSVFLGFGAGVFAIAAIFCVLSLVAGIMGKKAAVDPAKAGTAMVWMVVSAVVSLLCGDLIILVLSIVGAVYANKVKQETANFIPYGRN